MGQETSKVAFFSFPSQVEAGKQQASSPPRRDMFQATAKQIQTAYGRNPPRRMKEQIFERDPWCKREGMLAAPRTRTEMSPSCENIPRAAGIQP